jgi:hypothetical protein
MRSAPQIAQKLMHMVGELVTFALVERRQLLTYEAVEYCRFEFDRQLCVVHDVFREGLEKFVYSRDRRQMFPHAVGERLQVGEDRLNEPDIARTYE